MRKKWRDFWQDQFYISDWKDILALTLTIGFIVWCIFIIPHMVIDIKELIAG